MDFYTKMFRTVREALEIRQVVYDDNAIVGDFVSVFTAVEDAPDFVVAPLKRVNPSACRCSSTTRFATG